MIQRLSFVIAAGMAFTILFAGIAGAQETQTSPQQKEIDLLRSRVEDYRNSGDYQNLKKTMLELAATYHDSGNPEQEMMVDYSLSQDVWLEGDFQLAVDVLERAFRIARETNEAGAQPVFRQEIGFMKVKMGRLLEAKRDQEDALAMSRQSGDPRVESNCLHNLCWTYVHLGDMKTAREVMAKAQEIRKESDPEELPIGILSNAKLSLIEGNLKGAEAEYQSSIENDRDIGTEAREVELDLLLANGKFAEAEALGKHLLESHKKYANSAGQCRVSIVLARALAAQQKRTEAARILGEISPLLNKVEAFVRLKCALYQANFTGESDKSPVRMQQLLLQKEKLQKTEFVDLTLEATLLLGKAESERGHNKEGAALLRTVHQVASDKGFGWIAAQTVDLPQRLEPNAAPASRRN